MAGLLIPRGATAPQVATDAFVAATAVLIGDVRVAAGASIWFGCILRADNDSIVIGPRTNIQDGTIIHVDPPDAQGRRHNTEIGAGVTVGHAALLHSCVLEDGCFIGMRAVIMDSVVVESGAMVAAGALVAPGKRVRRGELWAGVPARFLRHLKDEELASIPATAQHYVDLAATYRGS
ncbi:MAG: gamma carbonic anhydrase family protein [Rhodospirillaceae bacterium]|nr:gamma carbonic anhydrase family protein [Rhodospirillaceae bacterium]